MFVRTSPQNNTKPIEHYHGNPELASKTTVYIPTELFNDSVGMNYHMGPVLSAPIHLHLIWYGNRIRSHKHIIREFINSLSASNNTSPSVKEWWEPLWLYTDQTVSGVTRVIMSLGKQKTDRLLSQGKTLTRLSMQSVIKSAITARTNPLPVDENGVYLVLTADDIVVQDFCSSACGFHSHTSASTIGHTLPYAWIGNSQILYPGFCAFPFAVEAYARGYLQPLKAPNGVMGVDGMINIIAHELAEVATDPFTNAWYAGDDPTMPNEVADICVGRYGCISR